MSAHVVFLVTIVMAMGTVVFTHVKVVAVNVKKDMTYVKVTTNVVLVFVSSLLLNALAASCIMNVSIRLNVAITVYVCKINVRV